MQHGANKARTPARNDAVKDIPNIKFESIPIDYRINALTLNTSFGLTGSLVEI